MRRTAIAAEIATQSWNRWRKRGAFVEVGGRRLFVVDEGPRTDEAILVLHGYPSCSWDYHRVIDRLRQSRRVIVHDHPGFGASDKSPDSSYSLMDQAIAARDLWGLLGVQRGHLVAHDYGTSVATELLARRESDADDGVEISSVTLSNGSVFIEMARLLVTQKLLRNRLSGPLMARLTSRRFFKARMRGLWHDQSKVDEADLDVLWLALVENGGRVVLPALSGYMEERVRFRERWVGALRRLDLPVLVLWGLSDPIAVEAIGRRLAAEIPDATGDWLDEVGHYPMLEAPERWSAAVLDFVDRT